MAERERVETLLVDVRRRRDEAQAEAGHAANGWRAWSAA